MVAFISGVPHKNTLSQCIVRPHVFQNVICRCAWPSAADSETELGTWKTNILGTWKTLRFEIFEIPGFKKVSARRRRKILRIWWCFMQKMPPDCTQERVFDTKTHPKCQKISACGGHIIIEIRLVNAPKVYFSRLRRAKTSLFEFYACLQGASGQA